jgi:nitrate reductase (NAD(P)H)
MTVGFHELVLGDSVEIKGPLGSFVWEGRGTMRWKEVTRSGVRRLGMICAGSGITPILQVLRAVLLDDGNREIKLWLLDANRTEQDILCREELDEYRIKYGMKNADGKDNAGAQARYKIHHTLSKPPEHWAFSTGRITDQMLQMHLPSPGDDVLILFCGPESMINLTVKPGLQRLGWNTDSSLVVF